MKYYIILFFLIFSFSATSQKTINIFLDQAESKDLVINDYFDSIEYIFLETTDDCLLDNVLDIYNR